MDEQFLLVGLFYSKNAAHHLQSSVRRSAETPLRTFLIHSALSISAVDGVVRGKVMRKSLQKAEFGQESYQICECQKVRNARQGFPPEEVQSRGSAECRMPKESAPQHSTRAISKRGCLAIR
jgi:hypothetical protein